jgi:arsenate reductase (glutaredoxin)
MIFFGLKTCDTCRKALTSLAPLHPDIKVIDVRADGIEPSQLTAFYARFGEDLINRRSTTWRGLDEATRAKDPVALLAEHPTLMKRPVIVEGEQAYLGWGKDVQSALGVEKG